MANLIKNGDFSEEGLGWTATNPDNVKYVTGHCVIAPPDSISQEVLTGPSGGGRFMISARMKTLDGYGGRITVQPVPTGKPIRLDISGGQDWVVLSEAFDVQVSTLKFTVTVQAVDGRFDNYGCYFGDVTLSKLL